MKFLTALRDLVLLVTRVALGGVLVWHGWDKLDNQGLDGVTAFFTEVGVPRPELAAQYATYVELVGGALLILGVLTPLVAALVVGDMGGAFWFVHRDNGVPVAENGYELVVMIAALALVFVVFGAGRLSVDKMLLGRRGSRRTDSEPATTTSSTTAGTGTTGSSYWDDESSSSPRT